MTPENVVQREFEAYNARDLGWTALLKAIILGDGGPRQTEVVRLLIAGGSNVNISDGRRVTPLAHARQRGDAQQMGHP